MASVAVGSIGFRVLDELRFVCEVVDVALTGETLSVRFLDNNAIEHDVELQEFEPHDQSNENEVAKLPQADPLLRPLEQSEEPICILNYVASFLNYSKWLSTLVRVSRSWRAIIQSPRQWEQVRVSQQYARADRMLEVNVADGTQRVCDVVQTLVFDDSDATDDQVLSLVLKCSQVRCVSLRRCSRVSFMVVYETLRVSRERQANGELCIHTLDLWLCRTISPSFVSELGCSTRSSRTLKEEKPMRILGPGFFFVDVSSDVLKDLRAQVVEVEGWNPKSLVLLWLPTEKLLDLVTTKDTPSWLGVQRHVPVLKVSSISGLTPLVVFDEILSARSACIGIPVSPIDDLLRLIDDYESRSIAPKLKSLIGRLGTQETASRSQVVDPADEDPLEAQAKRVFVALRQTTEQLQSQVDQLERQVAAMASAKELAEREYKHSQRELHRVSLEADRALLSLATSSDPLAHPDEETDTRPSALPPPPRNGRPTIKPDDELLPSLPESSSISRLARDLESENVAILDGFVGLDLSSRVRCDAEEMYRASRAADIERSEPSTEVSLPPPPTTPEPAARFMLGELAGGNTGRNLRYQMAHVRGDYMLWVDEHDAFCPPSIRLVLRQLDRLVLERLATENHELSMSALLRKKAMVTCYPGESSAHYTRHCDNPNRNGRKLTAILYLNAAWDPIRHGGELLIHGNPRGERRVAPLMDRLLLFFSDTRVPHEVLSCRDAERDRFALTVWYLDYDEYMHAQVFGSAGGGAEETERRRIQGEIKRLQGSS